MLKAVHVLHTYVLRCKRRKRSKLSPIKKQSVEMMKSNSDDLLILPHDGNLKAQEEAGETIELKEEEKKEVNEECYENTAFIGTPHVHFSLVLDPLHALFLVFSSS